MKVSFSERDKCPRCNKNTGAIDKQGVDSVGNQYNRRGSIPQCGHVWYYNPFLDWYKQLMSEGTVQ